MRKAAKATKETSKMDSEIEKTASEITAKYIEASCVVMRSCAHTSPVTMPISSTARSS
jgi:hypothetical protein